VKRALLPIVAGAIAGGVVGIILGPAFGLVAGIAVFALSGMAALAASNANSDPLRTGIDKVDELHPNLRQRLRPLLRSQEEIRTLLDKNSSNPILSVLSFDIQSEVQQVLSRAGDLLEARGKLRKLMFGSATAKSQLTALEAKRLQASDEQVAASIDEAIGARKKEIENYERLQVLDNRIEASLASAESILSELKSRVIKTIAESADAEREYSRQELLEMAKRMETISRTMEESAKALNMEGFES